MSIPREFIELLLAKIDIVDLINAQIPLQKKSGSNYFACCPFHSEKTASFSVSHTKQFYHCFGCGAHGNAIDFVMEQERLNFPEAIETLARYAGIALPASVSAKKEDSFPDYFDLSAKVAHYYYEQMRQSPFAIAYLRKRGITGNIAKQFCLGYAPAGWHHLIDDCGKTALDKNKLLKTGLIIPKTGTGYYDRFRNRIMFPIHDYRGRIIGFGGRTLDESEPKYLNSPETPLFQKSHALYGLYQSLKLNHKLNRILIVEGYMDVLALFQYGITYAVATMGTATTQHHLRCLFRHSKEIIFCFDGDKAGRLAASRALQECFLLMHDELQIRFLFLPEGEDPDSLIRKEEKAAFEARINTALSLSTFFFQSLSQQSEMTTLEGRARFASLALNDIKKLPPGIFKTMLMEELAKRARITDEHLRKLIKNPVAAEKKETSLHSPITAFPPPMTLAMALLIQYPELANSISLPFTQSTVKGYQEFTQLLTFIQDKPQATTGAILENWRGTTTHQLYAHLAKFDHAIPTNGIKGEFLGTIRQVAQLCLDEEINLLLAKGQSIPLSPEEKIKLTKLISTKKTDQTRIVD